MWPLQDRKHLPEHLDIYERLWTFSYLDGIEPTNNAAEQKARAGVLWRKTSHGSQSERGTRLAENGCYGPEPGQPEHQAVECCPDVRIPAILGPPRARGADGA